MRPGLYDITVYQGTLWNPTLYWRANDVLVNLTDYTAKMQVRKRTSSADVLVELLSTGGSPKITLGGVLGSISPILTAGEISAFTFTRAVYDLELTNPSGAPARLLQGAFLVSDEVTR